MPHAHLHVLQRFEGQGAELVAQRKGMKHMEIVNWLKAEHGLGHGHANAIVAFGLAGK